MTTNVCYYCQAAGGEPDSETELRPYGPNGATVCFICAFSTPERRAETEKNFVAALDAARAEGVIVIGEVTGPRPLRRGRQ